MTNGSHLTDIVTQVSVSKETYRDDNDYYRPEKSLRKCVPGHVALYLQMGKNVYLLHLFQFKKLCLSRHFFIRQRFGSEFILHITKQIDQL